MKKYILIAFLACLLTIPVLSGAQQVGSAVISKLAKDFDVSPDVLSKFKKMALPDLQSGLDIAKQVSTRGDMSMNDAASKVLGTKNSDKNWDSIAKEFDVEPPKPGKAKILNLE